MWYILNYIPGRGHRRENLPAIIAAFNPTLELFAPTFIQLREDRGQVKQTQRPLLYHYIFIRGNENDVKELCMKAEGFSFVIDRAGTSRHLVISDEQMEQFKIIAQYHSGLLPCYPVDGINLVEGDKVQVVSGPCAGLKGTYISKKGGKSGSIAVAIDSSFAAVVFDIKAEYVRILEFARDSKRAYDQLDAFIKKLTPVLQEKKLNYHDISFVSSASIFTRRLGIVKLHNPKLDAKLKILLYAAYSILSDKTNAHENLVAFRSLEQHVTNPKTKALCESILRRFA